MDSAQMPYWTAKAAMVSVPITPQKSGWPVRARVSFRGVAQPGRGEFVFTTSLGTALREPWRPALASALAAVRLGEIMIDTAMARTILTKLDEVASSLEKAKETERLRPDLSRQMGLTAEIVRFQNLLDGIMIRTNRARAAAQTAIFLQTAQSLDDEDMASIDEAKAGAVTLEEKEAAVRLAPAPRPGTRPVVTPPTTGTKPAEGFPWWGYVGIALGGLTALGGIVYLIAPSQRPSRSVAGILGQRAS